MIVAHHADTDYVGIATAVGTFGLAVVAFLQLIASRRSEARRAQPVAIAHLGAPRPSQRNRFGVHVTNEGIGTAFNVRFGVIVDGVKYASGGGRGTRHRVVPGGMVQMVAVDVSDRSVEDDEFYARVEFFATYEDAWGQRWATRNPADPLAEFVIRRVRTPWKERVGRWKTLGRARAVPPPCSPRARKKPVCRAVRIPYAPLRTSCAAAA